MSDQPTRPPRAQPRPRPLRLRPARRGGPAPVVAHGAAIRGRGRALAAELARADGCVEVRTPVLGKRALFERSGHWAKFADDMFPPMPVGGDELVLRPANCPHHALMYRASRHSWRELPMRLHEIGRMFRAERSGVLSGLQRVRQIALDDTHVFCRPDQVARGGGPRPALGAAGAGGARPADRSGAPVACAATATATSATARPTGDARRQPCRGGRARAGCAGSPSSTARRGRLLRPQADVQVSSARPRGDHRDRAGRLQPAGELRPHLRRRRRRAQARAVMIHRGTVGSMERVVAALRRAVRRPAAALAGAGAALRAAGLARGRRCRAGARRRGASGRAAGAARRRRLARLARSGPAGSAATA